MKKEGSWCLSARESRGEDSMTRSSALEVRDTGSEPAEARSLLRIELSCRGAPFVDSREVTLEL